jgi:dolichyl-phosphate-mannose-protein mannosyltransferase
MGQIGGVANICPTDFIAVSKNTKLLAAVFVFALVLRVMTLMFVMLKLRHDTNPDSYRSLAKNLAAGKGFIAMSSSGQELPNVARTPMYPLFLAGLICLGGDRLGLFLLAQCLLGALVCVLTAVFAARWLRPMASLLAGLLVAIDPNSILRCSDLRTETLFTLLLLAGACLIAWRPNRSWSWFATGLLWSLAALTRPIAVWIWLVALLILLMYRLSSPLRHPESRRTTGSRRIAGLVEGSRRSVCLFIIFLIGFLPLEGVWAARNHTLTGRCFISTISTYNLLMYRAAGIKAAREGSTLEEVQQKFLAEYGDIQFVENRERFNQSLRDYQQVASQILISAPLVLAKQAVIGCAKLLFGPGTRALDNSLSQTEPSARWWPPIYSAILMVVILLSLFGVRRLGSEALVPALLLLYFVVLASGPESNSRFRVPITPLLAVLAVAGVCGTEKKA